MKKYYILIIIFLLCTLIFLCFTCTYFDPFAAAGTRPSLYVIDYEGKILQAPLDNPWEMFPIPMDFQEGIPTCLTVDPIGGIIYWGMEVEPGNNTLFRMNLDGTKQEQMISNRGGNITSITIDPAEKMMYFVEGNFIYKSSLDSNEGGEFFCESPDENVITDIAIDFTENKIYFANNTINIYWKDMSDSGTSPGGVYTLFYPAKNLIIDRLNNLVFYSNGFLIYATLFPPNGDDYYIVDMSIDQIVDFAVDKKGQFVYWAESNVISRAFINGDSQQNITSNLTTQIAQFTIDFIR